MANPSPSSAASAETASAASARERKFAYLAWMVVCIVWGTTYLGIRVALETLPVATLAGVRWAAAGLVLVIVAPLVGQPLPSLKAWPSLALTGLLMAVIGNGGVVWAQQYVASGLAAVVVAMVPFWSVLSEALFAQGERVSRRTIAGLVLGFCGIIVLVWPELGVSARADGTSGTLFVLGIVALQVACFGWALGTSYSKRNVHETTPLGGLAVQMLLSGAMLLAIAAVRGEWGAVAFSSRSAWAMVYLVLIGSIVGYGAYFYALRVLPVSTVSLYAYINPLIAVLLGTLLLHEPLSSRLVLAAALVFCGVAVVRGMSWRGVTKRAAAYTTRDRGACATR